MAQNFLTPQDIVKIPFTKAEHRIFYGADPRQYGDLRLPSEKGLHSVLVVIHGGCWSSKFGGIDYMSPVAEQFTKSGLATWNIEYRCIGNIGGGWPGTFHDVGNAIDYLRLLAPKYQLDLNNVAVIGHSAGGHLALWAGARPCLQQQSELYLPDPLALKAVIDLGGPGDLRRFLSLQQECCNDQVINQLLGDQAEFFEQRLAEASPYEMLPLAVRQILITGEYDKAATPEGMEAYYTKAKKLGDDIELLILPNAAHFEVIDPSNSAWQPIENKVKQIFASS
jgi:acetyl esterase/lipase